MAGCDDDRRQRKAAERRGLEFDEEANAKRAEIGRSTGRGSARRDCTRRPGSPTTAMIDPRDTRDIIGHRAFGLPQSEVKGTKGYGVQDGGCNIASSGKSPLHAFWSPTAGEIARRIFRSAHEMGISSVAVYADGDADAPFVREADQAIALGGATSAETYLDAEKVLAAARPPARTRCIRATAFWPRTPSFAKAVMNKPALTWVGPSPAAIDQMGDKLSAKRLMIEADVPTLPAAKELECRRKTSNVAAAAKDIGFPLLVKASAGGGGQGHARGRSEADLSEGYRGRRRSKPVPLSATTPFSSSAGSRSSRHVEIQMLGDDHGNLVHCFERECSIQRRHQKVIEERSFARGQRRRLRERMGDAAVKPQVRRSAMRRPAPSSSCWTARTSGFWR